MEPPGHREIERQEFGRLFGRLVAKRVFMLPVFGSFVAWFWWMEPPGWRRGLLAVALAALAVFFVGEWLRFRRRGYSRAVVNQNIVFAAFMLLVVLGATGGTASPALVFAVPLGVLASTFLRWPANGAVIAALLAAVWALAAAAAAGVGELVPAALGGGARLGSPAHPLLQALFLTVIVLFGGFAGRELRRSYESVVRRALAAQQESLRAHQERAEELTALSGEIAHELKNPLASVKGLAGLLAGAVPEGKAVERLGVLRREVDRMQAILDEFLNFSRPLVPLALGRTDLAALCREVLALHEGMALDRGVALEPGPGLAAGGVSCRCDPRKVKQVLINLVQNALEASPRGAPVAVDAEPLPGGAARVRVLDRGRGLDPAVADALFSPGVTTKARGSGLGLTIARALARQHGGDLVLRPREGGGAEAELVLPGGAPGEAAPAAPGRGEAA
jgi:signal transduction histidine kinase